MENNKIIEAIKSKLNQHNSPEVEKSLKEKLEILKGDKTITK